MCAESSGSKRLALAAAYLEDRPVLLFDEWAADQDPAFKEVFYYQLLPELRSLGKTAIVISHDDRYFHVADRIVRLENGQVLCEGAAGAPGRAVGGREAVPTASPTASPTGNVARV